ncbi:hypothetical protein EXU30_00270 [Shewanella maritima]|uniref:Uncharacterized protein n=1 Tax=Shewanella maritima TaxID=2520507 RepID=A0A411PCR9_9GAMM|nr:hypothetical protein [Shewanella maritima]QBF81304.1 hypothetical protein EXU30_00270 [Shewanella maritima]
MPPETNPNYSYSYDSTGDGEIDRCYEPNELDSASNCGSLATDGTVMPMAGNTSLQVCVTNDNNGASCGFQMVSNGEWHYYEPDLEINCFGDSDVPDYDPMLINSNRVTNSVLLMVLVSCVAPTHLSSVMRKAFVLMVVVM